MPAIGAPNTLPALLRKAVTVVNLPPLVEDTKVQFPHVSAVQVSHVVSSTITSVGPNVSVAAVLNTSTTISCLAEI